MIGVNFGGLALAALLMSVGSAPIPSPVPDGAVSATAHAAGALPLSGHEGQLDMSLARGKHAPHGRTVSCQVSFQGSSHFTGPCIFTPEGGGSFSLTLPHAKPFFDGVSRVYVFITDPGKALVQAYASNGSSANWGSVTRSASDRACWQSGDHILKICAR